MIKKINLLIISCLLILLITSCNKVYEVNYYVDNELIETVEVSKGESITKISLTPTKSGHIFVGWTCDGKLFDFSTSIVKSIDLVAEFQVLPTNSFIDAEKLLTGYDDVEGYAKLKDQVALAVYKYNIDATVFENKIYSKPDTFITYLLESDNAKDILSFMVYYVDAMIELHLKDQYYYQLSASAATKAQDLYNIFLQSGYYNSNIASFNENIEFTNFIAPVMFNTLVLGTKYENAELWVINATSKGLLKEFDITKNNDKLLFKNKTNGEEFNYSYTEIERLIAGYQAIFKSTYSSTITLLTRSFEDQMKKLRCEKLLPLYSNNDEELDDAVDSFISDFSTELQNIYNSLNILTGLKSKFSSLVEEAGKIESSEELDEVVKNAINFKDQVVEEVESILPSDSIINNLDAINKVLHIEEFIYAETGCIPSINFDILKTYYNNVESFIISNLNFLRSINYTNYNIDVIVDGILDETRRTPEYFDEFEKLENNYMQVVNNVEILKTDLKTVFDLSIFMNKYKGIDTKLIIDVIFNEKLTEDLASVVISKLENITIEYTEEEIKTLYDFIKKISSQSTSITTSEVNEYVDIILKTIDSIDKELFMTLKPCIKEAMLIYKPTITSNNIDGLLKLMEDNFDLCIQLTKINYHLSLVKKIDVGLDNKNLLICQYEYLDKVFKEDNSQTIIDMKEFLVEAYTLLNLDTTNIKTYFDTNIVTRIDDVLVILNSNEPLTNLDVLYVNELMAIFDMVKFEYVSE